MMTRPKLNQNRLKVEKGLKSNLLVEELSSNQVGVDNWRKTKGSKLGF